MMIVVPFIPAHLDGLVVHNYMGYMNGKMNEEYGETLAKYPANTAIVDGKVVACAGIVQTGVNRWQAWALMTEDSGKYMLQITRAIKKFFSMVPVPRIETHVRADFQAGHRWMEMLEFKNETPDGMKNWGDDGYDYYLYARTK